MSPHTNYRPDIDGLRAVAVLAVVLYHAFPDLMRGGFVGVDIFFVISGYLISAILMKEREENSFTYAGFYARRIRRIFPALILVLTVFSLIAWFSLFADELRQFGIHLVGGGLFASNLVFWSEAGYFDQASEQKLLLHLWSLGIEEQFYIVWPILLGLIWRPRATAIGIVVLFAASFLINILLVRFSQPAAFYFPLARFWELLAGALLAWIQLRHPAHLQQHAQARSVFGLALLIAGFWFIEASSAFPGYWALLPVLGTALLISAGMQASINRWLLGNRLMVGIGLISYPLYLWHWPVMAFIRISKHGELTRPYALRAIFVSLLLAWLTYRFVETPFRRGGASRGKILMLSFGMGLLVFAGLAAIATDGFPDRKAATITNPALSAEIRNHPEVYKLSSRCEDWLGLRPQESNSVICLTSSRSPSYAILGDSHATSFHLAALLDKVEFDAVMLGQNGCLPFTEFTSRTPTENTLLKRCRESTRAALTFLGRRHDTHTVLLVTRGPTYYSGEGFGIEGKSPFRIYDHNDTEVDARSAFIEGYSQTISHLLNSGKRVIFVLEWPELGVDPRGCIGTRFLYVGGTAEKSSCKIALSSIEHRQADYRQIVNELKNRHPGMEIYDPIEVFCDATHCHGMKGDHVYYTDDDHLSVSGSHMIITDFLRWSSQPRQQP